MAQGESPQQCLQTENISFSTEQWPLTGVELERRKKRTPGAESLEGCGVEGRWGELLSFLSAITLSPEAFPWTPLDPTLVLCEGSSLQRADPPPQPHPGHSPPTGKSVTSISQRLKTAPTASPAGQPCSQKPHCLAGTEQDLRGDLGASNRSPVPLPWEPHQPRTFFFRGGS